MTTTQTTETKTFTLSAPFRGETMSFTPSPDGRVTVDHRFPQGMPGHCYRPGVGILGQSMTKRQARTRWTECVRAGWKRTVCR